MGKMTTRQISRDIAKWRAEQRRKKIGAFYRYIPAYALLLAGIFLCVLHRPLSYFVFFLGLLLYGDFIWYSYNAFWKDKTGKVLLKRVERMKKVLVEKRRELERQKEAKP